MAVFETAYYTTSTYWFGQNIVCSTQYANKSKICSMPKIPGWCTDSEKFCSMHPTSLPRIRLPTMQCDQQQRRLLLWAVLITGDGAAARSTWSFILNSDNSQLQLLDFISKTHIYLTKGIVSASGKSPQSRRSVHRVIFFHGMMTGVGRPVMSGFRLLAQLLPAGCAHRRFFTTPKTSEQIYKQALFG